MTYDPIKPEILANITSSLLDRIHASKYSKSEPKPVQPRPTSLCIPDCPICGGAGWIRRSSENIHDPDFGKLDQCPNRLKMILTSGDPRFGLDTEEVKELHWGMVLPDISAGPAAAQAVQKAMANSSGLVYLWGSYGQAKTLVSKIAIAETLRSGTPAAYANMARILDDLRTAFDENDKASELIRRSEWWNDLQVLAIDELDKVNPTNWAGERIHLLLDHRWTLAVREKALTIVAGNKSPNELSGYLASRILDSRFAEYVVHLDGPDGRLAMPEDYKW